MFITGNSMLELSFLRIVLYPSLSDAIERRRRRRIARVFLVSRYDARTSDSLILLHCMVSFCFCSSPRFEQR